MKQCNFCCNKEFGKKCTCDCHERTIEDAQEIRETAEKVRKDFGSAIRRLGDR